MLSRPSSPFVRHLRADWPRKHGTHRTISAPELASRVVLLRISCFGFRIWLRSSRRFAVFLKLIQLVVKRLEADAQLGGGSRFVAGVFFQNPQDVLHLDF